MQRCTADGVEPAEPEVNVAVLKEPIDCMRHKVRRQDGLTQAKQERRERLQEQHHE